MTTPITTPTFGPHPPSWFSYDPDVVGVTEIVAGDLLLEAGAPPIRVFEWVGVVVRVEPAGELSRTHAEGGAITQHWGEGESHACHMHVT